MRYHYAFPPIGDSFDAEVKDVLFLGTDIKKRNS
jgi:hypothetical protein